MFFKRGAWQRIQYLHTHHDGFAVHKTLGVLALLSFICRFANIAWRGEAGFQTYQDSEGYWTILSIGLHACLSISALIFKPPVTRSAAQPMIYKEFQLHSILFALRSCAVMLCLYLGYDFAPFRGIFILLAHWGADVVTSTYKQGSTMRDMPYPPGLTDIFKARLNLFYAFCQILAIVGCFLFGFDGAFLVLFPIQFAALLLTLVRKSIIDATAWHVLYIWSLSLAWVYAFTCLPRAKLAELIIIGSSCAFLRFRLRVNKYFLWVPLCLYTVLECDKGGCFSTLDTGYGWLAQTPSTGFEMSSFLFPGANGSAEVHGSASSQGFEALSLFFW